MSKAGNSAGTFVLMVFVVFPIAAGVCGALWHPQTGRIIRWHESYSEPLAWLLAIVNAKIAEIEDAE